jgi:hypothetical protein
MTLSTWRRILVLGAPLLLGACGPPRRPPETAATARIKDSAPEKAAAQRAASPGLALEADEQRWGIGAAQERKRVRDEQAARTSARPGAGTTTIDLAPVTGAPRSHLDP